MIRIVQLSTGLVVASAPSLDAAAATVALAPEDSAVHPDDALAEAKASARALVIEEADRYGERLTAGYPRHERESWPVKIMEARAIRAGANDPALYPVIAAECRFTGRTTAETAATVLARATPFAFASGAISGIRQAATAAIDAASDPEGVRAALTAAREAAEAAFAAIRR